MCADGEAQDESRWTLKLSEARNALLEIQRMLDEDNIG
jgi:hypothetical protein